MSNISEAIAGLLRGEKWTHGEYPESYYVIKDA